MSDHKSHNGKGTQAPKKNTRQWVKNEKLINNNSKLRRMRDIGEGFKPGSGISTGANDEQYKEGYDKINWNTDKPKPKFIVRVNGKVVSKPDE
jgi:hypothetical protein